MEYDLIGVFLIGVSGGFSHCIGMCGGFVLTYSIKVNENDFIQSPTLWQRISPHLLYGSGRILSYILIGDILGLVGNALSAVFAIRHFQGGLSLFAGLIMVFMGLDLAGLIPKMAPDSFPGFNPFKRLVTALFNKVKRNNILGLGFILGFIPCGLVYAAGAKAVATGSLLGGMLTMLVFGLGTLPAMVATGLLSGQIPLKLRSKIYKIAALLVVGLGIITLLRGVDALGIMHIYWL